MRRALAGPRAQLVDCGVLATPPHRPTVLHPHDVETLLLAGFLRRFHETGYRLCPAAVRRFLGLPWRRPGRHLASAGGRAGAPRG